VVEDTGVLSRSSGGITSSRDALGQYSVDMGANVTQCAYVAQIGGTGTTAPSVGVIQTYRRSANVVAVETFDANHPSGGTPRDRPFHLAVYC
jgi:hypothetical protein